MAEKYRYRVLVVDDEPMAVKAVCRVVERHCPAFVVAGEASNGKEALDKMAECLPDVVLTDIEMPVMNGLEMAKQAKEKHPSVCFVVISGYQEYAYMREAIRSGVLDYLAKPIVPSAITAMMERVRQKLDQLFYEKRCRLMRDLGQRRRIDQELMERFFPYKSFHAALIRENGLPRRFFGDSGPELFGTQQEAFCVYGRDGMEQLFLIPSELLGEESIRDYMEKVGRRFRQGSSYVTLLYFGSPFPRQELGERIAALYHWLNARSTIGKNQSVDLDWIAQTDVDAEAGEAQALDQLLYDLERLAKAKQSDRLKEKIREAYDLWEEQQKPQIFLEHASRRILDLCSRPEKGTAGPDLPAGKETCDDENPAFSGSRRPGQKGSLLDNEYQLEEAFYYATDMKMLRENLWNLFFRFEKEQKEKPKVDSPEFFQAIEEYLRANLAEPLSLQSVCDEFSISQAYVSKLFRKYAGQSFGQYLTRLRMEQAKSLMKDNPGLYIKDIAPLVGYRDQFYFSRIFHSYTGVSPADYLKG